MWLGSGPLGALMAVGIVLSPCGALAQRAGLIVNPAAVSVALPSATCGSGCVRFVGALQFANAARDSTSARYAPTQWKREALVGAVVGTALAVLVLTQCDSDANADCPGWGRAVLVFGVSTGTGALIGAMIKRSP